MANIKITDLTAYTDPATTDVVPIVDVGNDTTKKVSVGEVVGKISGDVDVATDGTSSIAAGVIVNADVNASAAIAGTKIDPDFGSQTIETTGVINAGSGTAAAPSVSVGTTDNGIYSPGTDEVAVATNGTGRLVIDSSGNIQTNGAEDRSNFLTVGGHTFGRSLIFDTGSGNDAQILNYRSTSTVFGNSGIEQVRITNAGLVGIGTSSPDGLLDVRAGSNYYDKRLILNDSNNNSELQIGTGAGIYWNNATRATLGLQIRANRVNQGYPITFWNGTPATNDGDLTTGQEAMRIDSSGRVGIGTTAPGDFGNDARLVIQRNGSGESASFNILGASNASSLIRFADGTGTAAERNAGVITVNHSEGSMAFSLQDDEKARIDGSGRLLVGTSTARAVGGTILGDLYVENNSVTQAVIINNENSTTGPSLRLGKSRGSVNGSNTIVQTNDSLGFIYFAGADGTDLASGGALINAEVDGTPGANDMPGRLVFSTTADGASSPTERMRITSEGRAVFGGLATTTGSTTSNILVGTANSTSGSVGIEGYTTITTQRFHASFVNGNGVVGSISTNGSATAFNTSSDYRLKENVVPLTNAVDRVNQLQVHRFNFIADPDKTVDGFLAHEAQAVVPECVTGIKDEVDDEGNPVYQGIDQSKLVPLLTAALQEALAKIETLEAKVAALESA